FPDTYEYIGMIMMRWKSDMNHYMLISDNSLNRMVERDHTLENLALESFFHDCVPHGITDYSSRDCLVQVGTITFQAHVETKVSLAGSLYYTVITICPHSLRVGLGRKRI